METIPDVISEISERLATLGAYPLLDPTESRYAEIARKMLETGAWLMPQVDYGVPFWGKPPLSTWLSAAAGMPRKSPRRWRV